MHPWIGFSTVHLSNLPFSKKTPRLSPWQWIRVLPIVLGETSHKCLLSGLSCLGRCFSMCPDVGEYITQEAPYKLLQNVKKIPVTISMFQLVHLSVAVTHNNPCHGRLAHVPFIFLVFLAGRKTICRCPVLSVFEPPKQISRLQAIHTPDPYPKMTRCT